MSLKLSQHSFFKEFVKMDKVYLKSLFLREKEFLRNLYSSEDNAKFIKYGNDKSLNVLIQILHLIASGEIHLRKTDSSALSSAKKLHSLHKFSSKKYFSSLLNSDREQKVTELKIFLRVYPILLYSFFNQ
jgi:hypothetical protein